MNNPKGFKISAVSPKKVVQKSEPVFSTSIVLLMVIINKQLSICDQR